MPRGQVQGLEVHHHIFLTLALDGGKVSASYPGYSTPRERASRTESTVWWAQMVWMFWKKAKYPAPAA